MTIGPTEKLPGVHLFFKVTLLLLPALILFSPLLFASQNIERKNVLVLFGFRPTLPVASQWDQGIRSVFEASTSPKTVIHIEYLDLTHVYDDTYTRLLLDTYRYKYSNPKPDIIIPVFPGAVDFMLKYGPDFFPGVPIVFGGVESSFVESRSLEPNITGHFTENNYQSALEVAIALRPNTKHITIISGAGPIGRGWSKACRGAYREYEDRFKFNYLIGLPLEVFLEKVANLPAQTVVIALPILKDTVGNEFVFNEVLYQITRASNAPVFTFWDVCLGTGIVGGYMSNFKEEGKVVAKLALRILNGEKPADIPVTQAHKFSYMFDWQQLKRWSISEKRLPQGSIVKFKELSVWDRYKGRIIVAFALILFQALIIFYLLYQRRIRRQAEEDLLQAEQKYRTVADFTYDWEYWQNPDGSLQYVSPSCERICGYSAQDFMANPSLLQDTIVPEDKAVWNEHRCGIPKEMQFGEIQFRIQKPDGKIRWVHHVCQTIFDRQGNNLGVRGSNRDVTKRESYKSETRQLQSELAHMDRIVTVSALTSALAHEVNQPLAAMRSYAQAALRFMDKDQPEYDSVRKALHGIVADNKRAATVINRLRGLVKKETGHWEALEINSIINDVISLINSEIILRKVSITLNLHQSVLEVFGDSVQIQQVLINLLTNALDAIGDKPIEARTITISTRPENEISAFVSISDLGEGIPPEKIKTIFAPFQTTKPKGIGLGLAICKTIMDAHRGKIWADNTPEGGAIFSLILPTIDQAK
jgi:PAS domain S-box-containing protein